MYVDAYAYVHTHIITYVVFLMGVSCTYIQAGSDSQEDLADNVVLKQFLDRIVSDRADGLEPEDKQRALVCAAS